MQEELLFEGRTFGGKNNSFTKDRLFVDTKNYFLKENNLLVRRTAFAFLKLE